MRLTGFQLRAVLRIGALYFVADVLLNKVILVDAWLIFFPLNGVTIALLLTRPRRQWPLFVTTVVLFTSCGEVLSDATGVEALVDGLTSIVETLLGALLLPAFDNPENWLRTPNLYPRFSLAVLVGPLLAAAANAAASALTRGYPYLDALMAMAPSEVIGVAAMVPLVLAVRSVSSESLRSLRWWCRLIVTLVSATSVMLVMFFGGHYPLIFLLYPLLMWIESMIGLIGSSVALCIACLLAAILTDQGVGPFAQAFGPGLPRNLAVQLYLAFHLICFLPVSVVSMERRRLTRELKQALSRATMLASVDALTGLFNRRTLDIRLREYWQRGVRSGGVVGLLLVDVDQFKLFNDRLGHQAGDDCLRAVANALGGQASRAGDVVARFGGEEFAVLLPDASAEGVRNVAEKMRAAVFDLALRHPEHEVSSSGRVTVSVGGAMCVPRPGARVQDLIAAADSALYSAKHAGRNCVRLSNEPSEHSDWQALGSSPS